MDILSQGLVGCMEVFIHPQYISSANGPVGVYAGLCAITIVIIVVFALMVLLQNWYKKVQERRALDAELDAEMEERTGP